MSSAPLNGLVIGITLGFLAWFLGPAEMAWWEFLAPPIFCMLTFSIFHDWAESELTTDTRYRHSYIVSATRMLAWVEEVKHTRQVQTGTDKDGNPEYETETYYTYEDHPERWFATDESGNNWSLDELGQIDNVEGYIWFRTRFGGDESRYSTSHSGQYSGGGKYVTEWDGADESLFPVSWAEEFENRGQATQNVYQYPKLSTEEQVGLYQYPTAKNVCIYDTILLPQGMHIDEETIVAVRRLWAKLGVKNACCPWILVYKTDISVAVRQETLWARGNDNDFVLCIGINDAQEITWTKIFAWAEDEVFEAKLAQLVQRMKRLDLPSIIELMYKELLEGFKYPDFKKLFGHIRIDMPIWAFWWATVVSLIASCGCLYWFLTNEFTWADSLETLNRIFAQ